MAVEITTHHSIRAATEQRSLALKRNYAIFTKEACLLFLNDPVQTACPLLHIQGHMVKANSLITVSLYVY